MISEGSCELFGPFALILQSVLAALALLTLVWKRIYENPRRPGVVWFLDVAKQVIGSVLIHFVNIFISQAIDDDPAGLVRGRHGSNEGLDKDECVWYFTSVFFDTTLGVALFIISYRIIEDICLAAGFKGIRSGDYGGQPPKISFWGRQFAIYMAAQIFMKATIFLLFIAFPRIGAIAALLINWTKFSFQFEVFFVMFFSPLVLDAIQYYLIDSVIKENVESIRLPRSDDSINDL